MIEIIKYTNVYKEEWDNLVAKSRVDTFLFYRDFMDYHSDRYDDLSFIVYRKGKIEALLPGNKADNTYYSHQGLTYGGLISTSKITTIDVIEIFQKIISELKQMNISEIIYKPLPILYQQIPAQEDIFALFQLGAEKIACNLSSTIFQNNKIQFIESRKSGIRKAIKEGVKIMETNDFADFWDILNNNLLINYGKKPVHSLSEITYLKSKFSKNIRIYNCKIEDQVVGGCVLFVMKNVIHVQYISANTLGRNSGALDLLFDELINRLYSKFPIFDFGQSTDQMGYFLNENLIFQKEGFGGRGIVYETFKYSMNEN